MALHSVITSIPELGSNAIRGFQACSLALIGRGVVGDPAHLCSAGNGTRPFAHGFHSCRRCTDCTACCAVTRTSPTPPLPHPPTRAELEGGVGGGGGFDPSSSNPRFSTPPNSLPLLPLPPPCATLPHHPGGGGGLPPVLMRQPPLQLSVKTWGASKGQVWTRHLAPAAPASQPSLPTQFHDCACHTDSALQFLGGGGGLGAVAYNDRARPPPGLITTPISRHLSAPLDPAVAYEGPPATKPSRYTATTPPPTTAQRPLGPCPAHSPACEPAPTGLGKAPAHALTTCRTRLGPKQCEHRVARVSCHLVN